MLIQLCHTKRKNKTYRIWTIQYHTLVSRAMLSQYMQNIYLILLSHQVAFPWNWWYVICKYPSPPEHWIWFFFAKMFGSLSVHTVVQYTHFSQLQSACLTNILNFHKNNDVFFLSKFYCCSEFFYQHRIVSYVFSIFSIYIFLNFALNLPRGSVFTHDIQVHGVPLPHVPVTVTWLPRHSTLITHYICNTVRLG